ncbi:hypothetical protein J1N35_036180 [Gossypium stocksii]|uniref:Uncharacterized protein n=1 Tax=Gossypium stocksii TaxID=47602 RepID=A0A9D3UHN5_9ROSI|nr:hypothetical protein J1N35_036180 [Gossypium stocksii]
MSPNDIPSLRLTNRTSSLQTSNNNSSIHRIIVTKISLLIRSLVYTGIGYCPDNWVVHSSCLDPLSYEANIRGMPNAPPALPVNFIGFYVFNEVFGLVA